MKQFPSSLSKDDALVALRSITNELSSEISFSSHLTQLVDKLTSDLFNLEEASTQTRESLISESKKNQQLIGENLNLKEEFAASQRESRMLESKLGQLQGLISAFQSSKLQLEKDMKDKTKQFDALKTSIESSKTVISNLKLQEDTLRKHIKNQDIRIGQLNEALQGSTSEVQNQSSNAFVPTIYFECIIVSLDSARTDRSYEGR